MSRPVPFDPKIYHVGTKQVLPYQFSTDTLQDLYRDPRGVLWMWEPPSKTATYYMGVDVSFGITNWSRVNRQKDDHKKDNGAICVLKVKGEHQVQVAEYAGPNDPDELADIANIIGRLYGGSDEDSQCRCIVEAFPGPGFMTQQRLISVHGYTNHYRWTSFGDLVPNQTTQLGWRAGRDSTPILWTRGIRHIQLKHVDIKSPWCVDEMANAEMDVERNRGRAAYGFHDDRVTALLLAVWYANMWSMEADTTKVEVKTDSQVADWQSMPVSVEQMMSQWNERVGGWLDD